MLFDVDLLSPCSGRSSIFEGPEREDLLLEVTAETGLWYRLLAGVSFLPLLLDDCDRVVVGMIVSLIADQKVYCINCLITLFDNS